MKIAQALVGATGVMLAVGPAIAQTAPAAPPAQTQPSTPPQTPPAQPPAARPANPSSEVVVTGERSTLRTSIDRLSYDVANDLQTRTGSIADALRNVPGVEVDVQGNVSLRGDGNVTILIDGRPSGAFRGEGRGEALQQFPADQIARVEVITNPNAALSPEGTAGVINLITKQDRRIGAFGSVRANAGTQGIWSLGASASRVGRKLTLAADAGFRAAAGENENTTVRDRLDAASGQRLDERVDGRNETTGGGFRNVRLAADYDPNPRDRWSAELAHRGFSNEGDQRQVFVGEGAAPTPARGYTQTGEYEFERAGTDLRLGFRRQLGAAPQQQGGAAAAGGGAPAGMGPPPGVGRGSGGGRGGPPGGGASGGGGGGGAANSDHEFVVDLRLEQSSFDRASDRLFTNRLPAAPDLAERLRYDLVSDEARLRVEYAQPLPGEARLRIGAEAETETNDYDNFGASGPSPAALTTDPRLTNAFVYEQALAAVFATYERPFGKTTVQAGLRVEQVETEIDQRTTQVRAENDYLRAYPTLFATYDVTNNSRLRASYSRRIQRPGAQDLNPFPVIESPISIRQGNPFLEPEITDSVEAGYQYRAGRTFVLATAFYRQSSDGITDVVRDQGGGVLLTTRENLAESRRAGVELIVNGRLSPTLSYNVSGTALTSEIEALPPAAGSRSGESLSARFVLSWTPSDKDFFQVNGFLNGEQLQAQGVREATGMLNLGYRRKVNERLSFVLTGQNVLDSFKDVVVINTPDLKERTERTFIPPALLVGFTVNFGDVAAQNRRRQEFEFETGGAPG